MSKAPCYGCDERHVNCHADCELYKEFSKERRKSLDERYSVGCEKNDYMRAKSKIRKLSERNAKS